MPRQRSSTLFGFRCNFHAAARFPSLYPHVVSAVALTATAATALGTRVDQRQADLLQAIVATDLRLETIGYHLTTANVARCRRRMPAIGIRPLSVAAYAPGFRSTLRQMFPSDTDASVEGVVPQSPAADAGIRPGDGLIRIDLFSLPAAPSGADARPTLEKLNALYASLFALPPDRPIPITLQRDGRALSLVIQPRPACRARFEVLLGKGEIADADGETIRVGAGMLAHLSDGKLAAIVAHEIAHNILGHARLSEQQHIHGGLVGLFGRSARMTRAMEDEADRLSLRLLATAGYDPQVAVALWREDGRRMTAWMPIDTSYRSWRSRAGLLEAELAAMRDRSEQ